MMFVKGNDRSNSEDSDNELATSVVFEAEDQV